jgi:hypothetical protein
MYTTWPQLQSLSLRAEFTPLQIVELSVHAKATLVGPRHVYIIYSSVGYVISIQAEFLAASNWLWAKVILDYI